MIYFVHAPEVERIKIGHSADCKRRLSDFTVGCPVKLNLLVTSHGSHTDEQALHRVFKAAHHRGEWFNATPELMGFCKLLLSVADPVRPVLIQQRISSHEHRRNSRWDTALEVQRLRECTVNFIRKHGKAATRELTGASRKTVDLWSVGGVSISAVPLFKLATHDSDTFVPFFGYRIERCTELRSAA